MAVAVSPLMPIGAAALAEPDPGVSADAAVLTAGAAAIVVLLVARVAWPARRQASAGVRLTGAPTATGPRSRLTAWPAAVGAPVSAAAGIRLALDRAAGAPPCRCAPP
jgi:hypothetical protein